jgi:acetylornithine deacetylase/succinyl-diaminopimelate desuccinylase-like protein
MTSLEKLLCELIALPSVNPAFLPPGHAHAGEKRVGDFLGAKASRLGLEVLNEQVFPERSNVLVRLAPPGSVRQRILLAPHLDTVGVSDDAMLRPALHGGRIHGRGACDTKGCVAAMFYAVTELAHRKRRPQHTEIVFAGLVDEENNQSGSRALASGACRAELAIVGEPTRLKVVTAHKGDLWLKLETRGRAAHGSTPHLGRNAVHAMAKIVDLLETEYAAALNKHPHPLLGPATINVGSIQGGVQPNIVPDRCSISIDRRTIPGENDNAVRAEIMALLKRHKLSAEMSDTRGGPCLPMETPGDLPLVQQFLKAAAQRQPTGVNFFCDASVLSRAGIPSIVFGPGDIAQAHTADEWIATDSLARGAAILTRFFESLP